MGHGLWIKISIVLFQKRVLIPEGNYIADHCKQVAPHKHLSTDETPDFDLISVDRPVVRNSSLIKAKI